MFHDVNLNLLITIILHLSASRSVAGRMVQYKLVLCIYHSPYRTHAACRLQPNKYYSMSTMQYTGCSVVKQRPGHGERDIR